MRSLRIAVLTTIAMATALAVACGSDPAAPAAAVAPLPEGGSDAAGVDASAHGKFGLDARPTNRTCVAPPRPPVAASVRFERVLAGVNLANAVVMKQPPNDASRWFAVIHGAGEIVSFAAGAPTSTTLACNLGALTGTPVSFAGEGGLLGLAFHPRFAQNGRLYVSWTSATESMLGYVQSVDGGQRFTQYHALLAFPRDTYHCGGGLAFGTDGLLYAGFGDAGVSANGQQRTGFYSKIIRLDVDSTPAPGATYVIPDKNPFKAGGGEPATFAWGFRNPFRISIDRATNALWVADVGQNEWEEVDVVRAGENHGWPCREGAHDLVVGLDPSCPSRLGLSEPIFDVSHAPTGARAIIGGVVYRGKAMPALSGAYVFGDFIRQDLQLLSTDPQTGLTTAAVVNEQGPVDQWTDFAEDADGEVYAVGGAGVYKMVPAVAQSPSLFPARLRDTGCFDPADPRRPASGLIPYGVNAPFWSDGADKERWFALPDGARIAIKDEGDFDLPVGSVVAKTFSRSGKRIETRLLVRHTDGEWAGYSYEWNDAESDATLLPSGKTKKSTAGEWTFPSRADCLRCHTAAAGRTLGLEVGQLNGDLRYPSTDRVANQLKTLEHIGVFEHALAAPAEALIAYPAPLGNGPAAGRARSYLHVNCSQCHRPGVTGRATLDLRYGTPLAAMKACGVVSEIDDLGIGSALLLAPASPSRSLLSLLPYARDGKRMPPLATSVVDASGLGVLDAWITSLSGCP